ncbi:apolipoprotein N-acyltransferase [Helicobacter pametensis]|uniref:apolipoprotein N-acyltransferase n=1 Tax=Helicobacter pametensis TaxID=95149 RepID=UPI00047F6C6C|nr:apolipoprotein N-acyltransferase [Helicobacter pametensis]
MIWRSLLLSFLFVLPLYWVWIFEFILKIPIPLWLNSICALLSFWIFLFIPSRMKFWFGFFVGLLWFYWVGFSFVYFGFAYLVPLISLVVACIYMLIFALALYSSNLIYRLIFLLSLSFIHPFGFDWMNLDSFLAYSYFGVSKSDLFMILVALVSAYFAYNQASKFLFILSAFLILCALEFPSPKPNPPLPYKFSLLNTDFSQDLKWQKTYAAHNATLQLKMIHRSIQEHSKLIILPETAFPFVLEHSIYFQMLKDLSAQSTLVVGALREKDGKLYNSTYVFQNHKVHIFDKVVLAPFGEKIPLPDLLAKPLSKIFLGDGAPQFSPSLKFGYFTLGEKTFKSVICYEGTSARAYEDSPPYLIVISNNAWFPHSIQPALQKNLMKYYSKLHQTTILHASNGSPSFVISP